ncbi:MAG: glycine zipper 2TM domain-containing protein [Rhodospirillaceae bacterium]
MTENKTKVSPIVAIAATSITLFSLVGIGVLTGIIPSSYSRDAEQQTVAAPAAEQKAPRERTAHRTSEPTRVASADSRAMSTEPRRVAAAEAPKRAAPAVCASCGTVTSVNAVEKKGEGSGLGAVAGGVVGGLLGNQVGGGNGRTIATVAGVAGGALAGHEVEKRYKAERHYDVAVRMDDGSIRHFTYESQPEYQPGDKVKVADGRLTR